MILLSKLKKYKSLQTKTKITHLGDACEPKNIVYLSCLKSV